MNEANASRTILPTIGRQVHFHMASPDVSHISGWVSSPDNTYAATIALVHNDRLVNLAVYDGSGYLYPMQSIPLRQPDDERPLGNWCEWPPHNAAGRVPILPPASALPTLNDPYKAGEWNSQRPVDGVTTHERTRGDVAEAIARNERALRAESSRHPIHDATQELDNDGNAVRPQGTEIAPDTVGTVTGDGSGQPLPTIPQD